MIGSDKDLTESPRAPSPLPHIPKNKIGPAVREATQKLLARLLTEDPITLLSLHETVSELSLEQVQDILDVSSLCAFHESHLAFMRILMHWHLTIKV